MKIHVEGYHSDLDIMNQYAEHDRELQPTEDNTNEEKNILIRCFAYLKKCGISRGEHSRLLGKPNSVIRKCIGSFEKKVPGWKMIQDSEYIGNEEFIKIIGARRCNS